MAGVYTLAEQDRVFYWVDLSEYDLETAEAMLKSKRYLYVGFMCHQSIEKILKGLYVSEFEETPPYSHNIAKLAENMGIYEKLSEKQKNLFDILGPLNIESRYPSDKEEILEFLNHENCEELIMMTKEVVTWIKKKL